MAGSALLGGPQTQRLNFRREIQNFKPVIGSDEALGRRPKEENEEILYKRVVKMSSHKFQVETNFQTRPPLAPH